MGGGNSLGIVWMAGSSFAGWISAVRPHPVLCFSLKSIEPPSPMQGKAWRLPDEFASFAAGTLGMGSAFPYEGKVPSCARRMRWSFWHKTSLPLCRGRLGGYRMNPLRLQLHAAVRLRCKRRRHAILRRWCRYTASADSHCSAHLPPIRARESRQRRR